MRSRSRRTALLQGCTVVASTHPLQTAHDADRIAVVIDDRIAELGSHHELVEAAANTRASGAPGPRDPCSRTRSAERHFTQNHTRARSEMVVLRSTPAPGCQLGCDSAGDPRHAWKNVSLEI